MIDNRGKILYAESVLKGGRTKRSVNAVEIGTKIKNARNESGLTQEQAAEALGVSRQTVSNWENEKSYPDIISVIKMSDLYSVSLDHLLKEEKPMNESYINYLEESTNVVKSKDKQSKIIMIIATLVIWAIALIVFWCIMDGSDAMAYSLVFLWLILPVTVFVDSVIIGKRDYFGKGKFMTAAVFGVVYMLTGYATFDVANGVATHTVRWPDFTMLPVGLVISLAGLLTGIAAKKISEKRKAKKQ